MSATLETFQYGLIAAREFRLFKFVPSASPQYDIAIEVKTVSTKPEERPTYDALSYVCGDTQDKVSILANGAILGIYRSLYGVLRELQEAGVSALLWADAICIYSYRTAMKHLGNWRFMPQFSEGFDFLSRSGKTHAPYFQELTFSRFPFSFRKGKRGFN